MTGPTVSRSDGPTVHLIPHTHWDREWYLPLALFQARLVPVIDAALDLLERDSTQRVTLDGQTVLLEDYLTLRPDALARVRAQVERGALEIGPWYVLADELIPSGESLVRNLLEGSADSTRLGARSSVLYSPDAFGHPAVLPSLAREFDLFAAALWRGMGNPAGKDHDFYRWIAPDGAGLPVYHLPPAGYEVGNGLRDQPSRWHEMVDALRSRAVADQVAIFTGADHHAVPDLGPLRDAHADARISTLGEFLRSAEGTRGPSVHGELRRTGHTWVLQGVHGTRSRMKRSHGIAELALTRLTEPLVALAGDASLHPALRRAWRLLIQSQFHDTIGGCSVDAVAETQALRLRDVRLLADETAARALDTLNGHDPDVARETAETHDALVLWNPSPITRSGVVTAELRFFRRDVIVGPPDGRVARESAGYQPFALELDAEPIPVQVLGVKPATDRVDARRHSPDQDEVDRVFIAFDAPSIGGLAAEALRVSPALHLLSGEGVKVSRGRLDNGLIEVRVSGVGVIDLTDHESGEHYPALFALEDETDVGDTYTFSRGPGRAIRGGRPISQSIIATGPLLGAIETRWELAAATGDSIQLRQIVVLHRDSSRVRVRLEVDNGADDHRLRARFPVDAGHEAVAGAAFGYERRAPVTPDRRPGLIERPDLTAPAHRYVAAAEGRRGIAVMAPGFFEYQWTDDHELLVTLVRSVGELSRDSLPERPGHAGWPEATPLAQERGVHRIDLVVAPIGGGSVDRPELLERAWEEAFLPVQARHYRAFTGAGAAVGFTLEGDGLVASAVKPGPDGMIVLRCWNARETVVDGAWISALQIRRAVLLRADETIVEELSADGNTARFRAGPRGIVTIGLRVGR
ncbi:MAG TPA: glycoside hydrolase family 38 C-terminal domain-containing protein [Gemmatimonadales bacterium]|nr:glycoside hydrolase family 38 C-terminal domain-containing protein [Gemmatimonadales bacterium]